MSYQQAMASGDYREAIALLDQLLQTDPSQPKLWYTKALASLSLGQTDAAIIAIDQALRLNPDMAITHRLLGKAQSQRGDIEGAISAYKQATRLYLNQQDKINAQSCLQLINNLQPKPTGLISSQDFLAQARAKIEQGQYRQALQDINWMLQLEPDNVTILSQRALIHARCHNRTAALKDLAYAIKLEPHNLQLRLQQGEMHLLLGNIDSALADFSALLSLNVLDPLQIYQLRGETYAKINQHQLACKDFSAVIAKDTHNAACYRARGYSNEILGQLSEALNDYRQAAILHLNQGNSAAYQELQYDIQSLEIQLQTQQAEENRIIRVPIKNWIGGTPTVEVMFNGCVRFDMTLDTGAVMTGLTQTMGTLLNVIPTRTGQFQVADGRIVENPIGRVQSIALDQAKVKNLSVSISPTGNMGLLGQNFLCRFDMRILRDEIELHPLR
ncbi:MAG: tetratricopeptide repeat protein [Cyanobacteria bacterium P01_F01_bin.116]